MEPTRPTRDCSWLAILAALIVPLSTAATLPLLVPATARAAAVPVAGSPLVYDQDFPDPFVLVDHGTYWGYGTNSAGANIPVRQSFTLTDWGGNGDALPAA